MRSTVRRMKLARMSAVVAVLLFLAQDATARDVQDATGRTLKVPDVVERIFAAGPPAALLPVFARS